MRNQIQYETNVIMVEANFATIIESCSHGSGLNHPSLADYIYEIQFINCKGENQIISKKDSPELIKTAAANVSLLGITAFLTIEMVNQKSVIMHPRKGID